VFHFIAGGQWAKPITATVRHNLRWFDGVFARASKVIIVSFLWVDRWKPYRVQLITGLLIPFLPACWASIRSPWHIVPINLASGFLWAGYELAAFNMLLVLSTEERRALLGGVPEKVVTTNLLLSTPTARSCQRR
jgi:hypothetical protein